jgi:hypothetical protein
MALLGPKDNSGRPLETKQIFFCNPIQDAFRAPKNSESRAKTPRLYMDLASEPDLDLFEIARKCGADISDEVESLKLIQSRAVEMVRKMLKGIQMMCHYVQ